MVFSKEVDTGACTWKWGDKDIPGVVSYGIEFANNGSWDSHVQKVINSGKKVKLRFLSNRNISTVARIVSVGTSPYFRMW